MCSTGGSLWVKVAVSALLQAYAYDSVISNQLGTGTLYFHFLGE